MTPRAGKAGVFKDGNRYRIARGVDGRWQYWSRRHGWIEPGKGGMTFRNAAWFRRESAARRAANLANLLG